MSGTLRLPEKARQRLSVAKVALPPTQAPEKPPQAPEKASTVIPEVPRRTVAELIGILATAHPGLFDWGNPVPLAIGIHRQLKGLGLSGGELRRALACWCERPAYRQALLNGNLRHGPDGATSPITPEQIEHLRRKP